MEPHIAEVVASNDRLLKALVTILVMRDPSLLDDLDKIFEHVATGDGANELSMPSVWKRVNTEKWKGFKYDVVR